MKKQYTKCLQWRAKHPGDFYYEHRAVYMHRQMRTFSEARAWVAADTDPELRDLKVYPRPKRNPHWLDPWGDYTVCRNFGKSWKDYTRHRKQWMVADDPEPDAHKPSALVRTLERMAEELSWFM